MIYQERILRLQTPPDYSQRLPLDACGRVMAAIPPLVEGGLRMAIEGSSVALGRPPAWFQRASDIRFIAYDHQGDDTLIALQIPTLGEAAAEELYLQRELWDTRPQPEETAFDVFRHVIDEVAAENKESSLYDTQLLKRMSHLRKVIGREIRSIRIEDANNAHSDLTESVVQTATRLATITPPSRQVRVAGILDMIRHSTRTFGVRLKTGEEVRGVIETLDGVNPLAAFLGEPVLVLGRAVYRPSGSLLRIDATGVEDGAHAPSVFSKVPPPLGSGRLHSIRIKPSEIGRAGVPSFFGTWPGDETDADFDSMVRELRAGGAASGP